MEAAVSQKGRKSRFSRSEKEQILRRHHDDGTPLSQAVEKRFGGMSAPRTIQFLSDRGSIDRANDTTELATQLNLKLCFTMAYSPELNTERTLERCESFS